MGIGRSMVHLHDYVRNLHNAEGSYQYFQDFASSIAFGEAECRRITPSHVWARVL